MAKTVCCINILNLTWPTSPPYLVKPRCSQLLHNVEMYYLQQSIWRLNYTHVCRHSIVCGVNTAWTMADTAEYDLQYFKRWTVAQLKEYISLCKTRSSLQSRDLFYCIWLHVINLHNSPFLLILCCCDSFVIFDILHHILFGLVYFIILSK